ncbi:MAG: 3-phosphoshikimate 1-carboxyvinyltransferase [Vampirovibrio sp.]
MTTRVEETPASTLNVVQHPKGLQGHCRVPGDKSISHRALMLASLVGATSQVRGLLPSADVFSTRDVLRQLGAQIRLVDEATGHWEVTGLRQWQEPDHVLDCGNSGTTIRLMSGLIAGQNRYAVLTGDKSLVKRPMGRVIQPLSQMGATWFAKAHNTLAPMTFVPSEKGLTGIHYRMPMASAQVKSAILLAGLFAEGDSILDEGLPSRDHSERMLTAMGATLTRDEEGRLHLPARQIDQLSAVDWQVPTDPSSAAFPMVAALLSPQSELVIESVGLNPQRTGLLTALQRVGAKISIEEERLVGGEPVGNLRIQASELEGDLVLDAQDIPALVDEIPILAVACVWLKGTLTVKGAEELRAKESDRLLAVATEFAKWGIQVDLFEDGLTLTGDPDRALPSEPKTPLAAWHDHRIAMALTVMNVIHNQRHPQHARVWAMDDPLIVNVSFPDFYDLLNRLQA